MLIFCFFMYGRVRLYVTISGILFDVVWGFWFSKQVLSIVNYFEICYYMPFLLKPLSTNRNFDSLLTFDIINPT